MLSKNWLHIETTNRCTLKCPACPRTVWHNLIKRPVPKADLNLDHLKSFLDCESMKEIDQFLRSPEWELFEAFDQEAED